MLFKSDTHNPPERTSLVLILLDVQYLHCVIAYDTKFWK